MHLLLHRRKGSLYKVVSRDVHWKVTQYIKGCSKKCKDSCTEIALNERADLYRQLTYNVGPEPYRVNKTSAEEFGCQHFFYTNWPSTQDFRFLHLNNTSSDIFFSGCFLRGWGGGGHVKKLNSFFSAGPGTGGGGGASRSAQEMHCT